MKSSRHLPPPDASATLLSVDGDTTAFSSAQSRPGMHSARHNFAQIPQSQHPGHQQQNSLHASHARHPMRDESSFGFFDGRNVIDTYGTQKTQETAELGDTTLLMATTVAASSPTRKSSHQGGGNSGLGSVWSIFSCCVATPHWNEALNADSPMQSPRRNAALRSTGSAPSQSCPRTQDQQQQTKQYVVVTGSTIARADSTSSESGKSLAFEGSAAHGHSTHRSGRSTQRPSSIASVVPPSTPTVHGQSPPRDSSAGLNCSHFSLCCRFVSAQSPEGIYLWSPSLHSVILHVC